jgi:hypothetical protein
VSSPVSKFKKKYKRFVGYFQREKGSFFYQKRTKYAKYKLGTDADNKSRLGMIRKFTFQGDYFPPGKHGSPLKRGDNGRFNSKMLPLVSLCVQKPNIVRVNFAENIGVKNFKKSTKSSNKMLYENKDETKIYN